MLGTPSIVTYEFLDHFREENLITPEGEYEEDYILEAPSPSERVCYLNHGRGPNWMWMYDVLITKFGIRIPFTHFQVTILKWTEATPSQLHPNNWGMIRAFEITYVYLSVPPSPDALFSLFTLTCPIGGGLTMG